jgi:hypothetical protein
MKKFIFAAIMLLIAWQIYIRIQPKTLPRIISPPETESSAPMSSSKASAVQPATQFKCDGRTRCSQMTSCEEAMFFLENCPGVEMDGDHDGVPCESQWCK